MSKKDSNSKQIELSSRTPLAEVAEQLQHVVDGLQAGTLTVENGDERIALVPTEAIEMRFQAKQKDRDERVTMELRWQRETTPDDFAALEITTLDKAEEVVAVETETPVTTGKKRSNSGKSKSKSRKRNSK